MRSLIPNDGLRPDHIPGPDAGWSALSDFALTFDGYAAWGSFEACAEIANSRRHETLTDLRTCLFFEQRRWRHFGDAPHAAAMTYIRSLVEAIRGKIASRTIDYRSDSAYSFRSALSIAGMHDVLAAAGVWDWRKRENHYYGDYIWATTDAPAVASAVRILEEGGRFFVDVEFRSNLPTAEADCGALHRRVLEVVLPSIGAEDVRRAEFHGR